MYIPSEGTYFDQKNASINVFIYEHKRQKWFTKNNKMPLFFLVFSFLQIPIYLHNRFQQQKQTTYLIVYFLILKSWPLKSMFTRFTSLTSFLLLENAPSPRMLLLTSLIECIVQKRGQTTLLSEISKDDIFVGKTVV